MTEETTNQEKLLCPKAGTATSSPTDKTASQSINIVNVMLWMKKNAYEESTIKKTKILRHLQRNCNTSEPEEVKLYIANKTCSNGRKQNLVEAYDKHIKSEGLAWQQPFYQRCDKKRK
jgi:hypothetical protein